MHSHSHPQLLNIDATIDGMTDLVKGVVDLIGAGFRIEVDLRNPRFAIVSPFGLDAAVCFLVANGRNAMAAGGLLSVSVKTVDTIPALLGQDSRRGKFIAISVADNGSGMSADMLEEVVRTRFILTEVWSKNIVSFLNRAFRYVKQDGGELRITSTLGEGTTATIYLAEAEAPAG
jgi:signal transduction histidine kinase